MPFPLHGTRDPAPIHKPHALIGEQNAEGNPMETEGMNVNITRISQVEIEEHVIGGEET